MRNEDLSVWGWQPVWRPRSAEIDIDVSRDLRRADPQTWLMFMDDARVARACADRLRRAGHRVVEVRAGDRFTCLGHETYIIAPERGREGYDLLLADLQVRGTMPSRIAHLWMVTADESHRPGSSFFHRVQEQGFYALLFLAQALADENLTRPLHLNVITSGAAQVRDEPLPHPSKSTIAGPTRVIPRELPGVTVSTLDIVLPERSEAPVWKFGAAAQVDIRANDALSLQVLEELVSEPANRIAALRERRFECVMRPVRLTAPQMPVFTSGTYLITGRIGLTFARKFAEAGANLILVARHDLPDRKSWPAYLARHAPQDAIARRIRAVLALEQAGAQVLTAAADICNLDQIRRVVEDAMRRFGPSPASSMAPA